MPNDMQMVAEAMVMAYIESVNGRDLAGLRELCWLEDERFAAITATHPEAVGAAAFGQLDLAASGLLLAERLLGRRDVRAYALGDDLAYCTALVGRLQSRQPQSWQRLSLILQRRGHVWGILHLHVSVAAQEESGETK